MTKTNLVVEDSVVFLLLANGVILVGESCRHQSEDEKDEAKDDLRH